MHSGHFYATFLKLIAVLYNLVTSIPLLFIRPMAYLLVCVYGVQTADCKINTTRHSIDSIAPEIKDGVAILSVLR